MWPAQFSITGATPNAQVFVVVGLANNPTPLLGGTLVPVPILTVIDSLSTNAAGERRFTVHGGPNAPATVYVQAVVPNGPVLEFSNALEARIGIN